MVLPSTHVICLTYSECEVDSAWAILTSDLAHRISEEYQSNSVLLTWCHMALCHAVSWRSAQLQLHHYNSPESLMRMDALVASCPGGSKLDCPKTQACFLAER